jgi:hypothetical protein
VSTNSICQGEQVAILWPEILKDGLEIGFAYHSFKWTNNAKGNAGVTCLVIGLQNLTKAMKRIYTSEGIVRKAKNINAYLVDTADIFVGRRNRPISNLAPMKIGNKPIDGGNYLFSEEEKVKFIEKEPLSRPYFFRWYGSEELLNASIRWCLLVRDIPQNLQDKMPATKKRIEQVRLLRSASKSKPTRDISDTPERFHVEHIPTTNYLAVPAVSSEKRQYVPICFMTPDKVASNLLNVVDNASTHLFAIISSRMHMCWVRTVGGRLETRIRYSSALCYNTFPFPKISAAQQSKLEECVYRVLDEREQHSERTLAELYDPDKMPKGLIEAHREMDLAVEQCYRKQPFANDEERLEYLFALYEQMIADEKKGA